MLQHAWLCTACRPSPIKPTCQPPPPSYHLGYHLLCLPSSPPLSYHFSKLTSGWGKEICGVLDGLVDYVLEKRNFSYRRPQYVADG